eukprot:3023260-Prymnesium_polylepis.1
MRYQLYLECMPTEELLHLDNERLRRMWFLALNSDRLKEFNHTSASAIISEEVRMEYARVQGTLTFKQQQAKAAAVAEAMGGDANDMFGLIVPEPEIKKPVPELAVIEVPAHEGLHQKRGFAFHTFLSKPEIIFCAHRVREECNKVLTLGLLSIGREKPCTNEEFEKEQAAYLAETVKYLKETWTSTLRSAVRNALKE